MNSGSLRQIMWADPKFCQAREHIWTEFCNSCRKCNTTECARDRDLHWLLPMRISNHKIFGLHPKVMLPQHIYACNFVVITLVCPTKVSFMKLKCNLLSWMWQHDFLMKQIFFSSIFLSENKGRLAKQAGYPGHDPWHTRYNLAIIIFSWYFFSKRLLI